MATMHSPDQIRGQREQIGASIRRVLETVATLDEQEFSAPSGLPGWTRAHVLTHLARASDARAGLLAAAREGVVGRQYPSEDARARDIEAGARRPGPAVRADLEDAFARFLTAVDGHPADLWEAEGEWLGGRRQPVHRVVPGLRREIEYHHVDLGAGYRPADWPEDFTQEELGRVARSMSGRTDAPPVTIVAPHATMRIGDGTLAAVTGAAPDLLAWMTGRSGGEPLDVTPPGDLPPFPPLG